MISVKTIDINKKEIAFDNKAEIFINGKSNDYPERIDRLINNSVTAKMASAIMTQYLVGRGFGQYDKVIVNEKEQTTLKQYATNLARELVDNRGVFIHVNYEVNADGSVVICNPKVMPFDWCRIGKKDDAGYNGKILVKTDWNDSKVEAKEFNVFNDTPKVLKTQIEAVGGIANFKGQIFYFNSDIKYHYPLARIDSVMSDCDSEAQASIYKNQLLRKGFFGKTLIVTRPLISKSISETIYRDDVEVPNPEYIEAESEAEQTETEIEDFMGAENVGGAMMVTLDHEGDKLEDAILVKNIEANIEPNLFKDIEVSLRENILIAYNNLPAGLVKGNDGMFSESGGSILEMKRTYWENTTEERDVFKIILNRFLPFETDLVITPLIEEETENKVEKTDDKL